MARSLPPHCYWTEDRHGKIRVRFQIRDVFSAYIYSKPGTKKFKQDYADCMAHKKPSIGAKRIIPGSIAKLIAIYYESPEFKQLADSTKRVFRGDLERFKAEWGGEIVKELKRKHMRAIIGGMSDRPSAANNLIKRLRPVLEIAIDLEWIQSNPLQGVKGYKKKGDGLHTWTSEEMDKFEARHPSGTKARLAYALLYYTASRRGDVVMLGRQHVQQGRLRFTQNKTHADMDLPIHIDLQREIDAIQHDQLTFLVTEYGRPFTAAGFGNWFRDRCNEAGVPQCSAHGLRKAATKAIIEDGRSTAEAGGVTGHKTLAEIDHYSAQRNQAGLADRAIGSLTRDKK